MNNRDVRQIMKTSIYLYASGTSLSKIKKASMFFFSKNRQSPIFFAQAAVEMYSSLTHAIDEAGGSGWPPEELLEMTVLDLLTHLSTNGIRFVFEKPTKKIT